jgi:DNA-binding CsgD family transcriptional regulator
MADTISLMVWTARADGTVDFFNQRILEYTGLDSRQLEGCGWEKKLSPRVLEDYIRERGPDHPLERLSRRELQVLKLIVEGNTSNQVSALLELSPKSIDTYRGRMMAKLEIDELASLVKFAIRHGVTSMEWLDAN